MLEGTPEAALTEDQQNAGLTLSDEQHFLLLRLDGCIVKILDAHSAVQGIRREADLHLNHKGLRCPYKDILCQEGWCSECNIYRKEVNSET